MPLLADQAPNTLSPAEKAAGWKLLFDGKSMKGWEDPSKKTPPGDAWTIEDGCLKPLPKATIVEDLFTLDSFGDFELQFDWRISPGGNSGFKYRIQDRVFLYPRERGQRFEDLVNRSIEQRIPKRQEKGEEYVIAFEYQVIDNDRHADAKRGPKYQAGALYDLVPAATPQSKPVGEFNHSRIVLRNGHVEHWLNGVKVVDTDLIEGAKGASRRWGPDSTVYKLLSGQPKKRTRLSLQNHGDEAWFRNIKIRELK